MSTSFSQYSLRKSTQFLNSKVFKHNSIRNKPDSQNNSSNEVQFHLSLEDKNEDEDDIHISESESESVYHDLELTDNSDDDSDLESENVEESIYYDSYQEISKVISEPINIGQSNMFYSNKNDYHLIKSTEYKYMSEPPLPDQFNNSLTNSFKTYLFNSIDFLRHSYYYISRKTI